MKKKKIPTVEYDYEKAPQGISIEGANLNHNYLYLTALFTHLLRKKKQLTVLEVGCGGGRNLFFLKSKFAEKIHLYGTDLSNKSVEYAKTLGIGHFAQAAIPDVPFQEEFDVILFVDILEHLPDIDLFHAMLQKAKDILKPNGLIYINIPLERNRYTYTWFCTKLHVFENLTERYFGHYLFFDDDKMSQLMHQNKLHIIERFYSAHFLTQIQMMLFFFIPKLILDTFFGEKMMLETRDSAINLDSKGTNSLIKVVKMLFLLMTRPLAYAAFYESKLQKNSSFLSVSGHYLLKPWHSKKL